jgi:hypothetical protein
MTLLRPTIDEILNPFFHLTLLGTTGIRRRRIEAVEGQLRRCMETEGDRILESEDLLVVASERAFAPEGAIARTMHADDLVFVLTIFVSPPWLVSDGLLLRVQLTIAERLTARLLHHRLVHYGDLSCPLLDIGAGIATARRDLKASNSVKARSEHEELMRLAAQPLRDSQKSSARLSEVSGEPNLRE